MKVTAPPLWSYGPGPSSLLIKDANMTDTTASSDAKQSQPAASSSGSELDRLRELAKQANAVARQSGRGWVRGSLSPNTKPDAAYIAAASPDVILALLAERQQDRQRIAALTEALDHTDDGHTCDIVEQARSLLSPEAQPSSGGDE